MEKYKSRACLKKINACLRECRGFTLVELIMVVIILAVLGIVFVPRIINLSSGAEVSAARAIGSAIAGSANALHMQYIVRGNNYILGTTRGPSTGVLYNANIRGATVAAAPANITVSGASARITMTIGRNRYTMTYTAGSPTNSPRVRFNNF
ncbi:MAG: prepilin-type N-terminal cleavage/methylation domain-containing protein [Deltaproteobacteria bacterium]|nr:prepilin-type N-terminal cleavage/methylation domain-containing protein [Deltaproteobacteria bacterium]